MEIELYDANQNRRLNRYISKAAALDRVGGDTTKINALFGLLEQLGNKHSELSQEIASLRPSQKSYIQSNEKLTSEIPGCRIHVFRKVAVRKGSYSWTGTIRISSF